MKKFEEIVDNCLANEPAFCVAACPLNVDAKGYISLLKQGDTRGALELIYSRLPFPGIMSRVCTHPCELQCKRAEIDDAISIKKLKRFIFDDTNASDTPPISCAADNNERIAVIGSGPAGLMAAWELLKLGYRVTIFELLPFAGGMLRTAIPHWRLPPAIVEKEIKQLTQMGAEFRFNSCIGKDIPLKRLSNDFKAIYVATGANISSELKIPGERIAGVHYGLDFLKSVNLNESIKIGYKAVVIGGGNVALDSARTALRLGASQVKILYRRSYEEMLATKTEVQDAMAEGITIDFLTSPIAFIEDNGCISQVKCVKMELVSKDLSGRRSVRSIPGSEYLLEAETAIVAIGQTPDSLYLTGSNLEIDRGARLQVNPTTYETNVKGIFAGGDVVTGPSTVINALYSGKKVAIYIDRYCKGEILDAGDFDPTHSSKLKLNISDVSSEKRIETAIRYLSGKDDFAEVDMGYSNEEALHEANRCLQCDCKLCLTECEFLKTNCQNPIELAQNIITDYKNNLDIAYTCNLCGLCEKICPQHLNFGEAFLDLRYKLVEEQLAPLTKHKLLIENQKWIKSNFDFVSCKTVPGSLTRIFFPGCNLPAYNPDLVISAYKYLQRIYSDVGIILGCCGAPYHDIGDKVNFSQTLEDLQVKLSTVGHQVELILACPDCYHIFKRNLPNIRISTIYEYIAEYGLTTSELTRGSRTFSIHDSCKTRYEPKIHDSVRKIVNDMGYAIEEIKFGKDMTKCCGMGGMAIYTDFNLVGKIIKRRLKEFDKDIVSYCATCRNAFAMFGKPSLHLLDLAFNPNWEAALKSPPAKPETRRKNQLSLLNELAKGMD